MNSNVKNVILPLNDLNHCESDLVSIFLDFILFSSDAPINNSKPLETIGHHSLTRQEQISKKVYSFFLLKKLFSSFFFKAQLQDIYRPVPKTETNEISSNDEEKFPVINDDNNNVSFDEKKKLKTKKNNYINVEQKIISSPKKIELPEDDAPILMPKQHKPMKKSSIMKQRTEELVQSEHYQLPPKDEEEEEDDEDEYRPPLPPKQRHQNNTSRALVYDFIGSELQELRATLAQFNGNSSSMLTNYRQTD
jgi:hypothetical protein